MDLSLLSKLNEERSARRAAVLVTDMASGQQRLVLEAALLSDPLSSVLSDALRMGKSGVVWGVPDVVKSGTYGGSAGWGGKKNKK